MSVSDFPPVTSPHKRSGPGDKGVEISAEAWTRLRGLGAPNLNALENIFKPAAHPPGVGPNGGVAMDEAFGPMTDWAWGGLESAVRSGLSTMTFLGFPALANLSQKAEYRRIVEILATEMTRKWIRVTTSSEEDKTEKVKTIQGELTRLSVRDVFKKVAEHDGFFGRGHIYLDFGAETNDDTELATSIGDGGDDISRTKVAGKPLRALRVVEPVWVYPQDYSSTDALSPDFYRPQTWYVQNRRVHASRLLTFVARPVSDMLKPAYSFGGVPMTQIAQLYVENWERIRNSVGRLIQGFAVSGLKTKLAEAANISADGVMNLQRRIDIFNSLRDNLGTFILDSEEEFFTSITPLGGLDQLQAQAQEHMAAVSGIPLVKLLGLSPHGLNASSEGEIRVFYDWVHAVQEFFFRPHLRAIMQFIQLSKFGEVDPDIDFLFEPLWTSSELEQAQVQQAEANTDKTYIDSGVMTALEVRRKVAHDKEMPYSGLDLKDAPDLSESERSDNATKMATPILQAFQDGLIQPSKALEELVAVGVFKTVTEQDIQEADMQPPAPEGGDEGGGEGGGGGPPQRGGGQQGGGQPAGAPNLRLASSMDAAPGARGKFDLGKLSKLESEELLRAMRDGDIERIQQIMKERETYRGAWDAEGGGFTVYHGSPFDISQFDASRIGTGTGRAHYGRGLYFASDPKIAEWYKEELTDRVNLGGKPLHLNAATTNIVGHVYRVEVHRPERDFIDWDKPVDQQMPAIRRALVRVFGDQATGQAVVDRRTAGALLKAAPAGITENLAGAGLAGVKYHDTHINGTVNYVVFDPNDVTIVQKDGQPVTEDRDVKGETRAPKGSKQGGQFSSGKWDATDPHAKEAEPKDPADVHEQERVSTRVPTAKPKKGEAAAKDPHSTSEFTVDYESAKSDKASFSKNVDLIRQMHGLGATKKMSDDETAETFINHVKSNVLALWDSTPDDIKSRSKLWYDGANKMAKDWEQSFKVPMRGTAACIACLSPQKDWFMNMSLAHRVIDTVQNHSKDKFSQRMSEAMEAYATLKEKGQGKKIKPNPVAAAEVRKLVQEFQGKTLADIKDPVERAYFVRFLDETENTRAFPVLSPEGNVLGAQQKRKTGGDASVTWGAFDAIAKAISVVDNPSQENISKALGGNHKVRNFYNNIMAPNSLHGDVTIDTHAIGAGNLMPWSGKDKEVAVGLGSGGSKSAKTGNKGLYAFYAEAYRRAAKEKGVLPREMQSVTWEAQRGLFDEDEKNDDLTKEVRGVWDDVDAGRRTADDARRQILSRGIKPPDWHKPAGGVHGQAGRAADEGQLHSSELGQRGGSERRRDTGTIPLALDEYGDWREEQHPREQHGRFTHKGGGVGRKPEEAPAPPHHHIEFHGVDPRQRQAAQLSWESAPGKTTQHLPQFHDAPLAVRRDFQRQIEGVLNDENGHDVIAKAMGLRTGPTFSSAGVFQGRVNPGAQGQVDIGRLTDDDKAKINAGEAVRGLLLRQDAAAWHKPELPAGHKYLIPGLKTANGVVFPEDTGAVLTHKDALNAMPPEDRKAYIAAHNDQNDANYVFKNDKGQVLSRVAARRYAEQEGLLSEIGKAYKQPKLIAEHIDPKASTRFVDIDPAEANMLDFRMGRGPSEDEATAIDRSLSSIKGLDYAVVPTQNGFRVLNTGSMPNDQFGSVVQQAVEGVDASTLPDSIEASRHHYVGDYIANDWSKNPNAESYLEKIGQAGPDVQRSADTLLATLGPKIDAVEKQFADKYGWTPDPHKPWSKGPAQDLLAANGGAPTDAQMGDAVKKVVDKYRTGPQIEKIRDLMKGSVPTNAHVKDGGHTLDDGTYTPERTALHKQILQKLFNPDAVARATPAPGTKPTMTILGGRGGSGKSWITGDEGPVKRQNTLVIDSDEFKQQLPEYQGWNAGLVHEESSHIADTAAEIAKQRGLNVAFDQTMKSGTSAPRRIDQFKDTHDLQAYYMHATPETAADRAMGRFARGGTANRTGRFVPPEFILGAHNNEKNFDAIIPHMKKWALFDNNGEGKPRKVAEGKNERSV